MTDTYIGIDVGTGSVRATLVRQDGVILASSTQVTTTFRDKSDHRIFEQSTTEIWKGIATSIRTCLVEAKVDRSAVKGVGIDATCSLAVSDEHGEPVTVTKGEDIGKNGERNIVLWADHRAEEEAEVINKSGSIVLNYVGGKMSLEMEIPKILWLKKHMPTELFARCQFFDLPDYLTYLATFDLTRSACSLTCKCSYVPDPTNLPPNSAHLNPDSPARDTHPPVGWQPAFFRAIGLQSIVDNDFKQLGGPALAVTPNLYPGHSRHTHNQSHKEHAEKPGVFTAGMPVGNGLSTMAAEELGLLEGTPVGSGVIDAYAGWIGTIAARYQIDEKTSESPNQEEARFRLAAVAGTSTCHLVQTPKGHFVPGVWGPYQNSVFPGWWMNEGGQSSTGQLIDFMISTHPAHYALEKITSERGGSKFEILESELERQRAEKGVATLTELTKDLHFYPDLHGNRSPIADPKMTGSISGLTLDDSMSDLAKKFNVTLEAIALQTRHILDEMDAHGHEIRGIYMSGSQAKNIALMQLIANICSVPVILPHSPSAAVVLGAAMLGRFAAEVSMLGQKLTDDEQRKKLWAIMVDMTQPGQLIKPSATPREKRLLEAKYKIFRETIETQKRWREEVENALDGED
ncbi:Pentulose kinase [Ramaria rubella]|nr:Pentulose kinase [Ramaria rubella]